MRQMDLRSSRIHESGIQGENVVEHSLFPPSSAAAPRCGRNFGFASRLSSQDSQDNSFEYPINSARSNGVQIHSSTRFMSASEAASDEQGNSSRCSFEGPVIAIPLQQLNKDVILRHEGQSQRPSTRTSKQVYARQESICSLNSSSDRSDDSGSQESSEKQLIQVSDHSSPK